MSTVYTAELRLLKTALENIIVHSDFDKETQAKLLAELAVVHMKGYDEVSEIEQAFEDWNNVMADIVEEHNLGRRKN